MKSPSNSGRLCQSSSTAPGDESGVLPLRHGRLPKEPPQVGPRLCRRWGARDVGWVSCDGWRRVRLGINAAGSRASLMVINMALDGALNSWAKCWEVTLNSSQFD